MKIVVAAATYNRPVITDICLRNLAGFRSPEVRLVVYDDCSTAYDAAYLQGYADEVVRFGSRGGISRSRARTLRDFIYRFKDFDLLYLTDNDTVHDAGFLDVIRPIFAEQADRPQSLPLSLFNSAFHSRPDNILGHHPDLLLTRTMPGVSQCYDRRMAATIVEALNAYPDLDSADGWDWNYMAVLNRPCLMTRTSYLEHFARDRVEGGLHNPATGAGEAAMADFERDRAQNPTPWLAGIRAGVIEQILG